MKAPVRKLWDSLKSSYWFLPLVMMTLALLLWLGTNTLDHVLSAQDKKGIAWLYISDADTIRTLLLTIAVAIIGVIGVVFTIIMVPLSIAASQFGPRLLRTFLRDTGTQLTLGTFNATFMFCMAVLLQLSGNTKHPLLQISVNVALLLALASFGVLIYFINHIAVSLQSPNVVFKVSKELHTAIKHDLPDDPSPVSPGITSEELVTPPDISVAHNIIYAAKSGYVQVRDDETLLGLACKHNLVLQLLSQPGDFVAQGIPLAYTWPQADTEHLAKIVNKAFILGSQRTLVQDVTFGINELVEVAIRALSPAINDPFTAMTCLDWIGSALCQMCNRRFPQAQLMDKSGNLRIIRSPITFAQLSDAAFIQIREYGRTSRYVTVRLMDTIKTIAQCVRTNEQRQALLKHAKLIEEDCHTGLTNQEDRQSVTAAFEVVKKMLADNS